ncbi:MAG: hypothetical protein HRU31_16210 [Rhodobacteraceae bacterium]|nr:hypothetical protein [Paracoccaceae bacterium]
MPDYALVLSPLARAAYFAQANEVAQAEVAACVPEAEIRGAERFGGLEVLRLTAPEESLPKLARMSSAQGLFDVTQTGWQPLDSDPGFALHPDFVWGEKYRGKTNETLTQMLINLGLAVCTVEAPARLLDPMCGRGTTLMWALRYGMSATGVERDAQAPAEWRRGLKKWTKLHRQKHKLSEGWVQKANRQGVGRFLDFACAGQVARMVTGDSADLPKLLGRKPFDLIVSDLPYGVQHMGGADSRSPLATMEAAARGWVACLSPGGAIVIAFNANIPKRAELLAAFEGLGLEEVPVPVAHRMSESILRDVLVLHKPA